MYIGLATRFISFHSTKLMNRICICSYICIYLYIYL